MQLALKILRKSFSMATVKMKAFWWVPSFHVRRFWNFLAADRWQPQLKFWRALASPCILIKWLPYVGTERRVAGDMKLKSRKPETRREHLSITIDAPCPDLKQHPRLTGMKGFSSRGPAGTYTLLWVTCETDKLFSTACLMSWSTLSSSTQIDKSNDLNLWTVDSYKREWDWSATKGKFLLRYQKAIPLVNPLIKQKVPLTQEASSFSKGYFLLWKYRVHLTLKYKHDLH